MSGEPNREWTLRREGREYSLTLKNNYVFMKIFLAWFLMISHSPRDSYLIGLDFPARETWKFFLLDSDGRVLSWF